jgi:putative flippase GtrA
VWNAYIAAPLLMVFLVEYAGVLPMLANPVVGIFLGVVQNYPINRFAIFRRPSV